MNFWRSFFNLFFILVTQCVLLCLLMVNIVNSYIDSFIIFIPHNHNYDISVRDPTWLFWDWNRFRQTYFYDLKLNVCEFTFRRFGFFSVDCHPRSLATLTRRIRHLVPFRLGSVRHAVNFKTKQKIPVNTKRARTEKGGKEQRTSFVAQDMTSRVT